MAHRSAVSPDKQWVLVVEMENGLWQPCRVVRLDGSSAGRQVGPPNGQCTYAAWSPDGDRMYFTANVGGAFHIWSQRFPDGQPEQLTHGPTEEEGIAVARDGRSLITSARVRLNSIWVLDREGEHQVSDESYAFSPVASTDGNRVYYLSQTAMTRGTYPRALPDLPAGGVGSLKDYLELPGARRVEKGNAMPGASEAQLFFFESTVIRNLYRVQLPP